MIQDTFKKKQRLLWFRKTSEYLILSTALCLTGCMGVYEGGFECPPGVGTKCKSISEVNELVNQGEIPKNSKAVSTDSECADCSLSSSEEVLPRSSALPSQEIEKPQIWWAPQGSAQDSVFSAQNSQLQEPTNNKENKGVEDLHAKDSI